MLSIVDSTTLTTTFTTSTYAGKIITFLQCTSSSLCVATDDSTSQTGFYRLTSADLLGGVDSSNYYSVAAIAAASSCGIGILPTLGQVFVAVPSRILYFSINTGALLDDKSIASPRLVMASAEDASQGVHLLSIYGNLLFTKTPRPRLTTELLEAR